MRSPVIAFSIFAAAAVSPTLVGAAPASPNVGIPSVPGPASSATDTATHAVPHTVRELSLNNDRHAHHKQERRVEDYRAAGGNSYSGSSGTVSGGDVINQAGSNDDTITNTDSSTGGTGGDTTSGDATGGDSDGFGSAGNAYSGAAGDSNGGTVANQGTNDITNTITTPNTAGAGGTTTSGDATGGDARSSITRRQITNTDGNVAGIGGASTSGDAVGGHGGADGTGGNAYSGAVGSGNGGNVFNGNGKYTPDTGSNGGGGGTGGEAPAPPPGAPGAPGGAPSGSGAGSGSGSGSGSAPPPTPVFRNGGGSAYSGSTGNDRGGDVVNVADDGETIGNTAGTNSAGAGGTATSGDATGGDA